MFLSKVPTHTKEVLTITEDGIYFKAQHRSTSPVKNVTTNAILQKLLGLDQREKLQKALPMQEDLFKTSKKSPRILITRAFSEESEKRSNPNTPNKELSKAHSSSATTLLDKKWKHLRYKVSFPMFI